MREQGTDGPGPQLRQPLEGCVEVFCLTRRMDARRGVRWAAGRRGDELAAAACTLLSARLKCVEEWRMVATPQRESDIVEQEMEQLQRGMGVRRMAQAGCRRRRHRRCCC